MCLHSRSEVKVDDKNSIMSVIFIYLVNVENTLIFLLKIISSRSRKELLQKKLHSFIESSTKIT